MALARRSRKLRKGPSRIAQTPVIAQRGRGSRRAKATPSPRQSKARPHGRAWALTEAWESGALPAWPPPARSRPPPRVEVKRLIGVRDGANFDQLMRERQARHADEGACRP